MTDKIIELAKQHCSFVDAGPTEVKIITTPSELEGFAAALTAQPKQLAELTDAEIDNIWDKVDGTKYMVNTIDQRRFAKALFAAQSVQPAEPPQEFEAVYAAALKASKPGTIKDIARLCYETKAAQPVKPAKDWPKNTMFTVKIRRDKRNILRPVRQEAEQLDGKTFLFSYAWTMDEGDPYPGETAWMPKDATYPTDAPTWIASGDLIAEGAQPVPPASDAPGNGLYRKKPVVVAAHQWFKNGDHPQDETRTIVPVPGDGNSFQSEGKVVSYYRHPDVPAIKPCEQCGKPHHVHGWIDTLEQGHRVCPGDWIITGVKGERYPCKPDIFALTYEANIAQPVQPATEAEQGDANDAITGKIIEIQEILDETYNFATTSPQGQQNINAVSDLLNDIAAVAQLVPPAAPVCLSCEGLELSLEKMARNRDAWKNFYEERTAVLPFDEAALLRDLVMAIDDISKSYTLQKANRLRTVLLAARMFLKEKKL